MLIGQSEIATLIPHAGAMCLLDGVLEWNESRIRCLSLTHRNLDNPLRRIGWLHSVCGIEYVSQAMAVHSTLTNPVKGRPKRGYLASVRNLALAVARLDTIEGDLIIDAHQILHMEQRTLYDFVITADGQTLISGRAAAVLRVEAL
jgi:predicted hotdog family 3-hydroxylacyl-ACP dehydratase